MIPLTIVLIALAVIYVGACFLVELEFFGWATLVLLATVVGVQSLHVFDILQYIANNALTSVLYAVGYIAIGVAWSFIKWFSFLMKYRDKFRELKQKFLDLNKLPLNTTSPDDKGIPYAIRNAFDKYVNLQPTVDVNASANDLNIARGKMWVAFLDENKTKNNQNVPAFLTDSFEVYLREQYSYGDYGALRNGKKPVATENKAKITAWMAFWPCSVISTLLNDPIRRLFRYLFNLLKSLYQKMADAVFADDPELK
jgi:hypothetical protein